MIALIVDFEAQPGQGEALREALVTQGKNSLENEAACRQFDVCVDPENPERFVLYELYDDEEAVEAHRATPYYQTFRESIEPIVKSRNLRMMKRL
jgi:quinol monooxygenase YgiN